LLVQEQEEAAEALLITHLEMPVLLERLIKEVLEAILWLMLVPHQHMVVEVEVEHQQLDQMQLHLLLRQVQEVLVITLTLLALRFREQGVAEAAVIKNLDKQLPQVVLAVLEEAVLEVHLRLMLELVLRHLLVVAAAQVVTLVEEKMAVQAAQES
jgi:hypothetical protein